MLYFLLSWCLLLGVSLALGSVVFADLRPLRLDRLLDRVLIAIWLGLGVTAIVLLLVSYVTPLSPVVGLALFVTVMIRSAVQWRDLKAAIVLNEVLHQVPQPKTQDKLLRIPPIQISKSVLWGTGLVTVGLAAWVDRPVVWNDTGYYHYSLIQWLGTYGTVPGLALLFNNLGFTSAWFALATPFNPVVFEGRAVAVTNGFAFLLLLGQWAIALRSILQPHFQPQGQKQARLADYFSVIWGALLIPVTLFMKPLSEILLSPSPDLPVTILVGVIAWVMLLVGDRAENLSAETFGAEKSGSRLLDNRDRLIPVMFAVMAVSFKLIALPLLPITLLFALWRQPLRVWLMTGMVTLCGLLPLIVGNLMTSGCPLYPGNVLCLDLPWTPARSAIAQVAQGTHGWTTWYGTPPPGANPWLWSLGAWWSSSSKEKITAIGIILALASALGVMGVAVIGRSGLKVESLMRKLDSCPELWVSLMGILGISFVMLTSPFFRFSVPYILTLLAISGAVVWSKVGPDRSSTPLRTEPPSAIDRSEKIGLWGAAGLFLVTLCLVLHRSTLLLPPPMVFSSTWVTRMTNGIEYFAPQSGDVQQETVAHKDMCWNAPIPCAYDIAPSVHLRDADRGIAGGFIRK